MDSPPRPSAAAAEAPRARIVSDDSPRRVSTKNPGNFADEETAAFAYNDTVTAAGLASQRKLNPVVDGKLVEKKGSYSNYYGVTWVPRISKWTSRIKVPNGVKYPRGTPRRRRALGISAWHPALAARPRNIRSVTAQVPNKKKKHLGYFDEEIEAAKAGDDYMSFRRVYIP